DKGTPFKFKLDQFEVIRGWYEGIATMKKGEITIFKIPPNLGLWRSGVLTSCSSEFNAYLQYGVSHVE
ncbi:hypothetical protein GIB67_025755, partial [Kingdonia uniflora]